MIPYYWNWKDYALVKPYVKNFKLFSTGINQWKDIAIEAH